MKNIKRAWSAFIDGKGKFVENASYEEPDLKWIRETSAGGGVAGETSAHMLIEEMRSALTMYNYDDDVIDAFGITVGVPLPFQFRCELFDTDTQEVSSTVIHTLATIDLEFPTWERRRLEGVKMLLFHRNYRRFVDGVQRLHIDPEAGIIDMGAGNILAATNAAIGRT